MKDFIEECKNDFDIFANKLKSGEEEMFGWSIQDMDGFYQVREFWLKKLELQKEQILEEVIAKLPKRVEETGDPDASPFDQESIIEKQRGWNNYFEAVKLVLRKL